MISKKTMVAGALAIVAIMAFAAASPLWVEEPEPAQIMMAQPEPTEFAFITFGVGIAIGIAIGMAMALTLAPPSEKHTDPAINDKFKHSELNGIRYVVVTANGMSHSLLQSDTEMLSFTRDHWNRVMEYSVTDNWTLSGTYDPDMLMARNMTYESLSTYLYNWQNALDAAYNQIGAQQGNWDTVGDGIYDSLKVRIMYGTGPNDTLISHVKGQPGDIIDLVGVATPTAEAGKVYIKVLSQDGTPLAAATDRQLHIVGPVGATGRIATLSGQYAELPVGTHDVSGITLSDGSNLKNGLYTLSSNVIWAGPISAASEDASPVYGGLMATSGSNSKLAYASGDSIRIVSPDGTVAYAEDLAFSLTYEDKDGNVKTVPVADNSPTIGQVIRAFDGIHAKNADLLKRAKVAGKVLWDLYNVAETKKDAEGNPVYLSPSSVTPQVNNVEITPEMSMVIATAALQQASSYYAANKTKIDGMKIDISLNGKDLICYGDIKSEGGVTLVENAIFTPLVYERDMAVTKGEMEWNQAGLALVYGTGDDFDEFMAAPHEAFRVVPMSSGMALDVKRMQANSEEVESFGLTLDRVWEHVTVIPDPEPPPEPVEVVSASILITIIMIELAAILALLGYVTQIRSLFLVAAIVALVGILTGDWMWKLYMGQVGFWDWLPKWRLF